MQVSTDTKILMLAHEKDWEFLEGVLRHLDGVSPSDVTVFTAKNIAVGADTEATIFSEFANSNIVVFFISSHCFSDNFLYKLRSKAIEHHDEGRLDMVQVLARSVISHDTKSVRGIKTIPKSPIAKSTDKDDDYIEVVAFILYNIELVKAKFELLKAMFRIKQLEQEICELQK